MLDLAEVAPRTVARNLHDDYQAVAATSTKLLTGTDLDDLGLGYVPWVNAATHGVDIGEDTPLATRPIPWFDPAVTVINS